MSQQLISNELLLCADACPEVCPVAVRDPAIMTDTRVLNQLLRLETFSLPSNDYFASSESELQPYMRRVVTTWMLEVCSFCFVQLSVADFFFFHSSCKNGDFFFLMTCKASAPLMTKVFDLVSLKMGGSNMSLLTS